MDGAVFSIIRISLENYFDIQNTLWIKSNISPDQYRELPFYELQYLLKKFKDLNERQKSERGQEGGNNDFNMSKHMDNMQRMLKSNKVNIPKLPKGFG